MFCSGISTLSSVVVTFLKDSSTFISLQNDTANGVEQLLTFHWCSIHNLIFGHSLCLSSLCSDLERHYSAPNEKLMNFKCLRIEGVQT